MLDIQQNFTKLGLVHNVYHISSINTPASDSAADIETREWRATIRVDRVSC